VPPTPPPSSTDIHTLLGAYDDVPIRMGKVELSSRSSVGRPNIRMGITIFKDGDNDDDGDKDYKGGDKDYKHWENDEL
jgi:hypothetical protein